MDLGQMGANSGFKMTKFQFTHCLLEAGDIVTQPMKSVSFVPKTILGSRWLFPEPPQLPFSRLAPLEAMHFYYLSLLRSTRAPSLTGAAI